MLWMGGSREVGSRCRCVHVSAFLLMRPASRKTYHVHLVQSVPDLEGKSRQQHEKPSQLAT